MKGLQDQRHARILQRAVAQNVYCEPKQSYHRWQASWLCYLSAVVVAALQAAPSAATAATTNRLIGTYGNPAKYETTLENYYGYQLSEAERSRSGLQPQKYANYINAVITQAGPRDLTTAAERHRIATTTRKTAPIWSFQTTTSSSDYASDGIGAHRRNMPNLQHQSDRSAQQLLQQKSHERSRRQEVDTMKQQVGHFLQTNYDYATRPATVMLDSSTFIDANFATDEESAQEPQTSLFDYANQYEPQSEPQPFSSLQRQEYSNDDGSSADGMNEINETPEANDAQLDSDLALLQQQLHQHELQLSTDRPTDEFTLLSHLPTSLTHYERKHLPYKQIVPIEIPQTVIKRMPRPYAINITIPKVVAVPREQELKIPIEKVKLVPVERNMPYIVQKRVPYRVERQILTPHYYPYPVKVPIVKTFVHRTAKTESLPFGHLYQHQSGQSAVGAKKPLFKRLI